MSPANTHTDELLRSAGLGGEAIRTELLARHRDRLRRMVAVRTVRARLVRALKRPRGPLEQPHHDAREGRP